MISLIELLISCKGISDIIKCIDNIFKLTTLSDINNYVLDILEWIIDIKITTSDAYITKSAILMTTLISISSIQTVKPTNENLILIINFNTLNKYIFN